MVGKQAILLTLQRPSLEKDQLDELLSAFGGLQHKKKKASLLTLQAGDRLYVEALQKEGGGGDNLAVAWEVAGAPREVIPGGYLSSYVPPVTALP